MICISNVVDFSVIIIMVSIIGYNCCMMGFSDGLDSSCYVLVIKVGMNSIDVVDIGDSVLFSRFIVIVGNFMLVMFLIMLVSMNIIISSI